jgi:Na+/H+ antiporter NhaA
VGERGARRLPRGFWERQPAIGASELSLELDLRHWISDALMAVFFFVVGLEIKRALVTARSRDLRAATLPVLAAVGGVALPTVFAALTAGATLLASIGGPAIDARSTPARHPGVGCTPAHGRVSMWPWNALLDWSSG